MSIDRFNLRMRRKHRERFGLLREWYGDDFAAVEVTEHVSHPVTLQRSIAELMAGAAAPEVMALQQLRMQWPEIAGGAFSKFTLPGSWKDGVLTVEVRHSALLRELRPSLEIIREAVKRRFPNVDCSEVVLTISGGTRRNVNPRPRG